MDYLFGQKYRYRIAKFIESKKQWWLMDEFVACLDRDTAKIIAFNLQKIAEQQSVEGVSVVSNVLLELGFDMHLLGSERYVKAKLENLTSAQLSQVRGAFVKNSHPRFSRHQPFGKTSD